jgi:hypothetical protein
MVRRLMSDWVHGGLLYGILLLLCTPISAHLLGMFFFKTHHKAVIRRACDFFAFAQKRLLSLERGVSMEKASSPPNS